MGLHAIYQLAIAVGLGFMVGLEREEGHADIAGVRTFPIITAFGYLAGLASTEFGVWLAAVGLAVTAAFMLMGNAQMARRGEPKPGMTSEYAAVVMFCVGLALSQDWNALAVAVSGTVLVLLRSRKPLHGLVDRLAEPDWSAVTKLVLIGFVVLPAMPDREMGPLGVLNPREIWLMVVLIVGISLGAYVAYRVLGRRAGTLVGGILGGLISSTASTLTFSRMTRDEGGRAPGAAVMILLASSVVFARVVAEIWVVSRGSVMTMAPPLVVMMLGVAAISGVLYWRAGQAAEPPAMEEPPSDLRAAVTFGVMYAVILLAVALVRRHFGEEALYAVSAFSGLTDMDAITLSVSQLVERGQVSASTGWRVILVGAVSNLVFKGGIVVVVGSRSLRMPVLTGFGAAALLALGLGLAWPG